MIKCVIRRGDPLLLTPCARVEDIENVQTVIDDLIDTIAFLKTQHQFQRGIGLAAPQIGISTRVSVVEKPSGERFVLINPAIIEHSSDKHLIREGCISFLEYRALVPRYPWVKVRAQNRDGQEFVLEGEGDFAMLLQHEIDHLDGILYTAYLADGEKSLRLSKVPNEQITGLL